MSLLSYLSNHSGKINHILSAIIAICVHLPYKYSESEWWISSGSSHKLLPSHLAYLLTYQSMLYLLYILTNMKWGENTVLARVKKPKWNNSIRAKTAWIKKICLEKACVRQKQDQKQQAHCGELVGKYWGS